MERSGVPLVNLFRTKIPIINGCPLGNTCKICDGDAVECSVKGSVYRVECTDCLEQMSTDSNLDSGDSIINPGMKGDSSHMYIGESSRPLRMRASEHYNNLSNLKPDSFMVIHWMDSHGLSMNPPRFKMKRVESYRDTFTRQISEALLIESEGSMNKRQEYESNSLYRLVPDKLSWEYDLEARRRANHMSNLINFTNVIKSVREKCDYLTPSTVVSNTVFYDSRFNNTKRKEMEDLTDTEVSGSRNSGVKRKKNDITSTPIQTPHNRFLTYRQSPVTESPIKSPKLFDLSLSLDSLGSSFGSDGGWNCKNLRVETGMSPELRRLLISRSKVNDTDGLVSLLKATIELTRAALERGLILNHEEEKENLKIYLENNAFFKPFGNNALDQITQMMNQVEIERHYVWDTWQAGEYLKLPRPERRGILVTNLEKIDVHKLDGVGVFNINPPVVGCVEMDGGVNTPARSHTRKREFSPSDTTQMGSLPKHPTKIKKDVVFREKFNKSLFDGKKIETPDGSPVLRQSEKRIKRTAARRLSIIPGQTLITSIFSPKTVPSVSSREKESAATSEEGVKQGNKEVGDNASM